jgi:hypothetical protein
MDHTGLRICVTVLLLGALVPGCGERPQDVRTKLNAVLTSELAAMVGGMPATGLSDSARYTVTEYRTYARGPYRALAIAKFRYLKGDIAEVVRTYRYVAAQEAWEPFRSECRLVQDTAAGHAVR